MGKTIVLTGATSGIGTATAEALSALGHELIFVVRDEGKAEELLESHDWEYDIIVADLLDLSSVKSAARQIRKSYKKVDILINNAGGIFSQRVITKVGVEKTFALNHLGHYALTTGLIDPLSSAQGKIINVSSEAHRMAKLDLDDLAMEENFTALRAYANAKLCNILFTIELNRRYGKDGLQSHSLHPGVVRSGFGRGLGTIGNFLYSLAKPVMISPKKGAQTTVYLVENDVDDPQRNFYFKKSKPDAPDLPANVEDEARKLWAKSETLLKKR